LKRAGLGKCFSKEVPAGDTWSIFSPRTMLQSPNERVDKGRSVRFDRAEDYRVLKNAQIFYQSAAHKRASATASANQLDGTERRSAWGSPLYRCH
jgi:hypothetical protein